MAQPAQHDNGSRPPVLPRRIDTVVIGGGQAGLVTGYHLSRAGVPFVIVDASERIGDAWRKRWDSLKLFTPARFNSLPGLPFPGPGPAFVGKDAMADYLESYAAELELPVHLGVRVRRLSRVGSDLLVETTAGDVVAGNVVVAMANSQVPWVPSFARNLDPAIRSLHSATYRDPSQLQEGPVLVVGAGNSGAELALEVAAQHRTFMSGKESGHIPFRIDSPVARHFLIHIVRFVGHHVLTVRTPIGRRLRPKLIASAAPLIRVRPKDLEAAGVERVPRVIGMRFGSPELEDGRVLDVANVLWCTGYRPGFTWIDLPVLGEREQPLHERGIVPGEPGLYFVGLHFLYAQTSETVTGVGRDARRVVRHLVRRRPAPAGAPDVPVSRRDGASAPRVPAG